MDLTETEDIKRDGKNAQNYTRSAQWCDHSPRARHPRMGSQMGFRNITMNKASGCDGIPVELFQTLKDDELKCCTQYASKFGKLSSGHRTGKGQFSSQYQRKTMPKNAQTNRQLHSSHTLAK